MSYRPLPDRAVVKRVDAEQKTKGGITIGDTAREKPQESEAIGRGNRAAGQDLLFIKSRARSWASSRRRRRSRRSRRGLRGEWGVANRGRPCAATKAAPRNK